MSDLVIKVENIFKEYRLGVIDSGYLIKDMQSWWARIRGRQDPNSKIGTQNNHNNNNNGSILALNDVSFEVKQGEILGIIGRNGAGKSTLLKILSRVTTPTKGSIKINGRVGSLLEVGTGFHPELTGKENIFLNGAILGMRRSEINKKLDEIVSFAEIEKFMDTPVKRYSSGMYVRLAFAVAAHLDPEILVVDEVLAVGDAEFQKKCLGKMGDIAQGGRTVLFVSHNMEAVKSLCTKAILLEKGEFKRIDSPEKVISSYISFKKDDKRIFECQSLTDAPGNDYVKLISIKVESSDMSKPSGDISYSIPFKICIEYLNQTDKNIIPSIFIINELGYIVFPTSPVYSKTVFDTYQDFSKGKVSATCIFPAFLFNSGFYSISVLFFFENDYYHVNCSIQNILSFEIHEDTELQSRLGIYLKTPGIIKPRLTWRVNKII